MDIYQLQVFAAVYNERSFSRAARALHLTQPAVSAHIKRLEEHIGAPLFDRIGRKVVPTPKGDLLHARADDLIRRFHEIEREMGTEEEPIKGLITMGANSVPAAYVIPWLASEFKREHPNVFFQIMEQDTPTVVEKLLSGEILLGVVEEGVRRDEVVHLHRIEDELVLVTQPGFIPKKTITPLRLVTLPLLVQEKGSESRTSMDKHHLMHKISLKALNITAILGSTDSVREAVRAGLGAAILSRHVVRHDLDSGALEEVRIRGVRMRRTFHVIARAKRTLPAQYQSFVGFIKTPDAL
jgi:DNA-binding transcriptional LysR family regulator